jgi:hypothetical protein
MSTNPISSTSTLTHLRTDLCSSSLPGLHLDFTALEFGLQNFKRYHKVLMNSLQEDDTSFRAQVREAEDKFSEMKSAVKRLLGEFEDVEGEIAEYLRPGKTA